MTIGIDHALYDLRATYCARSAYAQSNLLPA
jgi:hypothetical protein